MTTLSKSTVAALLLIASTLPSSWAHHYPIRGFSWADCTGASQKYETPQAAKNAGMKSYADIVEGGGCVNFCP